MTLRAFSYGAVGLFSALACAPATAQPPAASKSTATAQQLAAVRAVPAHFSLPPLSPDCGTKRVPGERFRRPLRRLSRAVHAKRSVRVLVIGSSSTAGVGASSVTKSYVARLEPTLEGALKGLDFEVIGRGKGGEEAQGAADRMKREVADAKPDLVVWQVGTNDAIDHVGIGHFKQCLKTTLAWLRDQKIDVVLVDPQYGRVLARDEHYEHVVAAVAEVAKDARVLLVDRFEAMRELSLVHGDRFYLAADNLHLNDTGHRCMAEQLARSIVAGLMAAEAEPATMPASAEKTVTGHLQ